MAGQPPGDCRLLSARATTLEILAEINAHALDADQASHFGVDYLDLQTPARADACTAGH